ncbi:MAG: hypothetical protein H6Q93_210 [Nitrospirae bacterium]|nr:hypothetical protein [Nitrospirota bacterium]MBS1234290.1 hypothetical protein [Nitrospirota bacterium]
MPGKRVREITIGLPYGRRTWPDWILTVPPEEFLHALVSKIYIVVIFVIRPLL